MEFEYRNRVKIINSGVAIVAVILGIALFSVKGTENNNRMFIIIMATNMFMQFIQYLDMKNTGMGVVDYLDYGRVTKLLIFMYGIVIIGVVISGEYANFFLGILMIILAIITGIQGGLFKLSNGTQDEDYHRDKIILNEEGIKIPNYRFIKWDDISNVIEYDKWGGSIIGILVSNARDYKINNWKVEDILFGKNVRLITILRKRVIGVGGLNTSELVVAIKENMKG